MVVEGECPAAVVHPGKNARAEDRGGQHLCQIRWTDSLGIQWDGSMALTNEAQDLLERHRAGDPSARDTLIGLAQGRFVALARAMLRRHPHVRRWEETDDLLQAALMRLHRSLAEVQPENVRHFDNLAATQVRRELIDLARSYHGPEGLGARHHTDGHGPDARLAEVADAAGQPESLEVWVAFHEAVDRLPEPEREVVNLLWYENMTHPQAAETLGVATKTIQRRWASARLMIGDALHGERLTGGEVSR
jgi:RNA polymerase sigma factor (sigma-70 family)